MITVNKVKIRSTKPAIAIEYIPVLCSCSTNLTPAVSVVLDSMLDVLINLSVSYLMLVVLALGFDVVTSLLCCAKTLRHLTTNNLKIKIRLLIDAWQHVLFTRKKAKKEFCFTWTKFLAFYLSIASTGTNTPWLAASASSKILIAEVFILSLFAVFIHHTSSRDSLVSRNKTGDNERNPARDKLTKNFNCLG